MITSAKKNCLYYLSSLFTGVFEFLILSRLHDFLAGIHSKGSYSPFEYALKL
jgi:hypothetical protein